MSKAGFKSMQITPEGREKSKQVMAEHLLSLTDDEFEAITRGREPVRGFSSQDIAIILTCYAACQLESRSQAFLKAKLNEILARVYEP